MAEPRLVPASKPWTCPRCALVTDALGCPRCGAGLAAAGPTVPRQVPEQYQRSFETAAGLTAAGPHQLTWESNVFTAAVALVCGCGQRIEADILKERSSEHVLFHQLLARMGQAHAPRIVPADLEDLRGLTIHQPWLWAIDLGLKPGENRSKPMPPHLVGRWVALHAGKAYSYQGADWIARHHRRTPPLQRELPCMAITGLARFGPSELVQQPAPEGDWKCGPWWWPVVERVLLPEPIIQAGFQGPWRVPPFIVQRILDQLGARRATG